MSFKVFANAYFGSRRTLQSGNTLIGLKTSSAQSSQTRCSEVDQVLNPICEVRVDEVIDKRKTHRGVAIAILVYHKESHYSCDVFRRISRWLSAKHFDGRRNFSYQVFRNLKWQENSSIQSFGMDLPKRSVESQDLWPDAQCHWIRYRRN